MSPFARIAVKLHPNRSIEVKKPAFHLQPKNTQNFYKSQKPLKTFWLFRYLSYIKGKKGVWFTTEIWWISKFLKNQNTLKKGSYRGNVSEGNQWIEALSYWHGNHLNDTMGFGSWPRNCLLHVHVQKNRAIDHSSPFLETQEASLCSLDSLWRTILNKLPSGLKSFHGKDWKCMMRKNW